ncbi:MAG: hypothetical protein RMJ67_06455 [Elusimicrobiota bacterium]|nr:hypothetical protein [Endomicrobiia bacterium]MDW8166135.1 hypothetical protein [Elusimicrobiota bacterium]
MKKILFINVYDDPYTFLKEIGLENEYTPYDKKGNITKEFENLLSDFFYQSDPDFCKINDNTYPFYIAKKKNKIYVFYEYVKDEDLKTFKNLIKKFITGELTPVTTSWKEFKNFKKAIAYRGGIGYSYIFYIDV